MPHLYHDSARFGEIWYSRETHKQAAPVFPRAPTYGTSNFPTPCGGRHEVSLARMTGWARRDTNQVVFDEESWTSSKRISFWTSIGTGDEMIELGRIANLRRGSAMFFFMFAMMACAIVYFSPTIIARQRDNVLKVFMVNFLIGWTVVGWVITLIWALGPKPGHETGGHA
jgi:hypothetical protein